MWWVQTHCFLRDNTYIYVYIVRSHLKYIFWHVSISIPSFRCLHWNSSTTSVWPTNVYIGELRFDVFHNKRLFSPRRNCGTTIVTKPSPKGYKKFVLRVMHRAKCSYLEIFYFLNVLTVYLALHTGEFVVKRFSALRGLIMSKILTVQSWLDDANWFCWKGHQSKPCIWNSSSPFQYFCQKKNRAMQQNYIL